MFATNLKKIIFEPYEKVKQYLQKKIGMFSLGLVFDQNYCFFDQFEDNMSWSPCSNNPFATWEPIVNPVWVSRALNRPQKGLNIKLNGRFSQP